MVLKVAARDEADGGVLTFSVLIGSHGGTRPGRGQNFRVLFLSLVEAFQVGPHCE